MTIQGKLVPGIGAKMKLTNGPVTSAKTLLTCSSIPMASWAEAAVAIVDAARAAKVADIRFMKFPLSHDGDWHVGVHHQILG